MPQPNAFTVRHGRAADHFDYLDDAPAIAEVRAAFAAAEANPLPRSVRYDLETALGLAEAAPDLYDMGAGTRGRFTLIATCLRDALTVLDEQAKR